MFLRRLVLVLAPVLLIGGCRSAPPPELPLAPPTSEPTAAMAALATCGDLTDDADLATVEGRYQLILASVDAVRAGRCDPIELDARVCRSLFLIAATDPLLAIGAGLTGGAIDDLIERHAWALVDGRSAADAVGDPALGRALEQLSAVAIDVSDTELAAAAVARAAPEIIEPVAQAEVVCAAAPR